LALIGAGLGAFLFALTLLIPASPATGHSLLIESSPAANSVVTASPPEMILRFNNRIEKKLSRIRLVAGGGGRQDLPLVVSDRADTLKATVPALSPGAWRVEWQVLSTDGHVVSGVFAFRVGPGPTPEPAGGAALPSGRSGVQPR
jgi:methionine-rich copper-binding protein CopC